MMVFCTVLKIEHMKQLHGNGLEIKKKIIQIYVQINFQFQVIQAMIQTFMKEGKIQYVHSKFGIVMLMNKMNISFQISITW